MATQNARKLKYQASFESGLEMSGGAATLVPPGEFYFPIPRLKSLTSAGIRAIVLVASVFSLIAVLLILLAAEATVTQHEINQLEDQITQVNEDIVSLKVEIEQAQSIDMIRSRAINELEMHDPDFDQYVYLSELQEPPADFKSYIRQRIYGTV